MNHFTCVMKKRIFQIILQILTIRIKKSDFSFFFKMFGPENVQKCADANGERSTDFNFETTKLKLDANKKVSGAPSRDMIL